MHFINKQCINEIKETLTRNKIGIVLGGLSASFLRFADHIRVVLLA